MKFFTPIVLDSDADEVLDGLVGFNTQEFLRSAPNGLKSNSQFEAPMHVAPLKTWYYWHQYNENERKRKAQHG